ncbi:MAG: hypothetical protein MJ139_03615 [Limosilactobacillus sp.]|nr:hypothetical protein [Limosilactobacillus sp.]
MRLHTLGPQATDSYQAALVYQAQHPCEIDLHSSFEEILTNLRHYHGDYLLLPTAYQGQGNWPLTWGQTHYRLLDQLNLQTAFITSLDDLVIVENQQATTSNAYTHPATRDLLQTHLAHATVITAPSKYRAYQAYLTDGRYVLTSRKLVHLRPYERLIKTFEAKMIWSVYEITARN